MNHHWGIFISSCLHHFHSSYLLKFTISCLKSPFYSFRPYFYAISFKVNSSQTGAFYQFFYSHSWGLIIYLSSWTLLYSIFLISSQFLHPLTSFQFRSRGGRNTLSLLRSICLIFSLVFTLSAFLSVSILLEF